MHYDIILAVRGSSLATRIQLVEHGRTDDNKATHMSVAVRSKSTSETFRNRHMNSHIVNMYVEYDQSTQHIYCLFVIFCGKQRPTKSVMPATPLPSRPSKYRESSRCKPLKN